MARPSPAGLHRRESRRAVRRAIHDRGAGELLEALLRNARCRAERDVPAEARARGRGRREGNGRHRGGHREERAPVPPAREAPPVACRLGEARRALFRGARLLSHRPGAASRGRSRLGGTMSGFPETADVETSSDDYARRFAGTVGAWFLERQADATRELLADLPHGAKVVDVGGGHAQLTPMLVEAGY